MRNASMDGRGLVCAIGDDVLLPQTSWGSVHLNAHFAVCLGNTLLGRSVTPSDGSNVRNEGS